MSNPSLFSPATNITAMRADPDPDLIMLDANATPEQRHGFKRWNLSDMCPVCLEKGFETLNTNRSLSCGHIVCLDCVPQIFAFGLRCPSCRKAATISTAAIRCYLPTANMRMASAVTSKTTALAPIHKQSPCIVSLLEDEEDNEEDNEDATGIDGFMAADYLSLPGDEKDDEYPDADAGHDGFMAALSYHLSVSEDEKYDEYPDADTGHDGFMAALSYHLSVSEDEEGDEVADADASMDEGAIVVSLGGLAEDEDVGDRHEGQREGRHEGDDEIDWDIEGTPLTPEDAGDNDDADTGASVDEIMADQDEGQYEGHHDADDEMHCDNEGTPLMPEHESDNEDAEAGVGDEGDTIVVAADGVAADEGEVAGRKKVQHKDKNKGEVAGRKKVQHKGKNKRYYEIEDIVAERRKHREAGRAKIDFLIEWKGRNKKGNPWKKTWEPAACVTAEAIEEWKKKRQAIQPCKCLKCRQKLKR